MRSQPRSTLLPRSSMRRLELFALAFAAGPAWAQLPATVTLDEALSIVARSPRVVAAERDADAARAERVTAGALPNPNFSLGTSRLAGGERTVFDANSQQQATVELPIPVFGQREARVRAAERQVGRADSQVRLTVSETRRQAALEFARLLQAQEGLAARRAALGEIERIRGLVSGRLESGMASRYDLARADAELALAGVAVQRAEAEVSGHAAALAALADASGWRPRAAGALQAMQVGPGSQPDAEAMLAANPAARVARDDSAAAEARIELARRGRPRARARRECGAARRIPEAARRAAGAPRCPAPLRRRRIRAPGGVSRDGGKRLPPGPG